MQKTILDAMHALGEGGSIFGLASSREGEKKFKSALGGKLREMTGPAGWSWNYEKEERFITKALKNKLGIKVDIVGRHHTKGMVVNRRGVPTPIGAASH
jgi:hypothetical protein